MKYVSIFHANLNYAYLEPHKYESVIRSCYELIVDTFREVAPEARYVFEASGYTIDQMAERTPDVVAKLRDAVERGQCEFMGSPYAHPILANIPREDATWSCEFAMRAFERHLGFRPESAWNPECTWMQHVPYVFRDVGFRYLTLDFESYMCCNDKDYAWTERNRCRDMLWGGNLPRYDLDPDHPALHRPFRDVVPGLGGFCRSNRLVGGYIRYFRDQITVDQYVDRIRAWSGTRDANATVIVADDAEYTGTTAYYFVKYYQDCSRSFSPDPGGREKLERFIEAVLGLGEMITFKDACELEPYDEPFFVEDRFAWHRTYADAWGSTPEAREWDPILDGFRRDYKQNVEPALASRPELRELVERFWFHLTCSANSDGRWPPPPAVTCPFNRQWVLDHIEQARRALAELKEAVGKVPAPEEEAEKLTPVSSPDYGYEFTEKDPRDVRHLNLYELQHSLYAAYKQYDHAGDDAQKEDGRAWIRACYEEFARRGFTGISAPPPLGADRPFN